MSNNNYDAVVIAVGSMDAAACYHLAVRGWRVLGLEQFESIPHDKGSHAGQSRIIRKAYFEHPDYVPLLQRAYHNWQQLEEQTGEQVYFNTGLVYHGPSHHPVMKGVEEAAAIHSLQLDKSGKKYPQFNLSSGFESIFETDAGFLRPEKYSPTTTLNVLGQPVPDPTAIGFGNGQEWEFQTYLQISIGNKSKSKKTIMKKIKDNISIFALFTSLVLLTVFGCKRELDDLEPAAFPTTPEVFIDGFSAGLNYGAFGGSKVTAFDVDTEVKYKGSASMKFAVPDAGDSQGAYAGGAYFTSAGRDLSGYDALTFWARASKAATIDVVGFGNDFGAV